MLLTVESVKPTRSGKSVVVTAGGKDYFALPAQGITAGMTIDAETKNSEYQGKTLVWIDKYSEAAPPKVNGSTSTSGHAWLPMASNLTAHAISAGLIKEPSEVKMWIAATKQAFEEVSGDTRSDGPHDL